MNEIKVKLREQGELFGGCPQVGDKVFARIEGHISKISAELIDVGDGQVLPGETFVSVLVEEVVPS